MLILLDLGVVRRSCTLEAHIIPDGLATFQCYSQLDSAMRAAVLSKYSSMFAKTDGGQADENGGIVAAASRAKAYFPFHFLCGLF